MKSILGYTRTSLDTFDERPFCQVDSLVLSSIAYTFFPKEILPEGDWNGIHFANLLKAECFERDVPWYLERQKLSGTVDRTGMQSKIPRYLDLWLYTEIRCRNGKTVLSSHVPTDSRYVIYCFSRY